jgi:hypothetical protein
MTRRPTPICFWDYDIARETASRFVPTIDAILQEGTTPLVKTLDGRRTRNFVNFHHPRITEPDYLGPRAILDNRHKLVIHDAANGEPTLELFDLRDDPAEEKNLVSERPEIARGLQRQLREWQQSVLESLTGRDDR